MGQSPKEVLPEVVTPNFLQSDLASNLIYKKYCAKLVLNKVPTSRILLCQTKVSNP